MILRYEYVVVKVCKHFFSLFFFRGKQTGRSATWEAVFIPALPNRPARMFLVPIDVDVNLAWQEPAWQESLKNVGVSFQQLIANLLLKNV